MTEPQEAFVVEYPCKLHCRVEVDLTDVHLGFTHRQMRAAANVEHAETHEPPPVPTPIHDGLKAAFRAP